MAEINVNWRRVPKKYSLHDLTRGWFENRSISYTYNQRVRHKTKHQMGGTAIIAKGETATREYKTEEDLSKLGRWTSMVLRGKDNIKLRVVSVYIPHPTLSFGSKKSILPTTKRVTLNERHFPSVSSILERFLATD